MSLREYLFIALAVPVVALSVPSFNEKKDTTEQATKAKFLDRFLAQDVNKDDTGKQTDLEERLQHCQVAENMSLRNRTAPTNHNISYSFFFDAAQYDCNLSILENYRMKSRIEIRRESGDGIEVFSFTLPSMIIKYHTIGFRPQAAPFVDGIYLAGKKEYDAIKNRVLEYLNSYAMTKNRTIQAPHHF